MSPAPLNGLATGHNMKGLENACEFDFEYLDIEASFLGIGHLKHTKLLGNMDNDSPQHNML